VFNTDLVNRVTRLMVPLLPEHYLMIQLVSCLKREIYYHLTFPNLDNLGDAKNFEITNALGDTIKQAVPGIFVVKQCNQEMQSEHFTHKELCISILKQFNAMLTEFNNQTKTNVTQLMAESAVQQ